MALQWLACENEGGGWSGFVLGYGEG